jgi:hypothetical protein
VLHSDTADGAFKAADLTRGSHRFRAQIDCTALTRPMAVFRHAALCADKPKQTTNKIKGHYGGKRARTEWAVLAEFGPLAESK